MASIRALLLGEHTFGFHDIDDAAPHLTDALAAHDVEATVTTDRDALADLDGYDLVCDYLTDSRLTDAQRDGLLGFVRDGGGYAGVHCASDLTSYADADGDLAHHDDPFPELRELVGGHFLGHPEQQDVEVTVRDGHPITDGVPDFTVFDEPYDLDWDDDVEVLATQDHPSAGEVPVVWVKSYGDGRVYYNSLGHTEDALTNPQFRTLLGRGARWAAGADPLSG